MATSGDLDETRHMLARLLGYLMIELGKISDEARDVVAHEVVACVADFEKMDILANLYINHLVRLCESYFTPTCQLEPYSCLVRRDKGPTPGPSEHLSHASFSMHSTFFGAAVDPAPRDHQAAKKSVSMLSNSTTPTLSYSFEGFKA